MCLLLLTITPQQRVIIATEISYYLMNNSETCHRQQLLFEGNISLWLFVLKQQNIISNKELHTVMLLCGLRF